MSRLSSALAKTERRARRAVRSAGLSRGGMAERRRERDRTALERKRLYDAIRARYGLPPLNRRAQWDPEAAQHDIDKAQRRAESGTVLAIFGTAFSTLGAFTGNPLLQAVGAALGEGAKQAARQAAAIVKNLPGPVQRAAAENLLAIQVAWQLDGPPIEGNVFGACWRPPELGEQDEDLLDLAQRLAHRRRLSALETIERWDAGEDWVGELPPGELAIGGEGATLIGYSLEAEQQLDPFVRKYLQYAQRVDQRTRNSAAGQAAAQQALGEAARAGAAKAAAQITAERAAAGALTEEQARRRVAGGSTDPLAARRALLGG